MASGWLTIDWGTVPAWVSTASVVTAAATYFVSARDKQQEQASKVSCYVSDEVAADGRMTAKVVNRSNGPIYSVTVTPFEVEPIVISEVLATATETVEFLPSTDKPSHRYAVSLNVMRPFIRSTFTLDIDLDPLPEITFRDATGRWWNRDLRGNLQRVRSSREPSTLTTEIVLFGYPLLRTTNDNSANKETIKIGPFERTRTYEPEPAHRTIRLWLFTLRSQRSKR